MNPPSRFTYQAFLVLLQSPTQSALARVGAAVSLRFVDPLVSWWQGPGGECRAEGLEVFVCLRLGKLVTLAILGTVAALSLAAPHSVGIRTCGCGRFLASGGAADQFLARPDLIAPSRRDAQELGRLGLWWLRFLVKGIVSGQARLCLLG